MLRSGFVDEARVTFSQPLSPQPVPSHEEETAAPPFPTLIPRAFVCIRGRLGFTLSLLSLLIPFVDAKALNYLKCHFAIKRSVSSNVRIASMVDVDGDDPADASDADVPTDAETQRTPGGTQKTRETPRSAAGFIGAVWSRMKFHASLPHSYTCI